MDGIQDKKESTVHRMTDLIMEICRETIRQKKNRGRREDEKDSTDE